MIATCPSQALARSCANDRLTIPQASSRPCAKRVEITPWRSQSGLCSRSPHSWIARATEAEGKDSDEDIEEVIEAKSIIENNPQFASVFKNALQRRGKDELKRGARPIDENKPSPAEEVLLQALRQSRRNLLRLEELQKLLENAQEIEGKQFERIQFALKRATADAAFIRTLQKLRAESQSRGAAEPQE